MDYSKMKKAQLTEEIEALQEKMAEPECADAEGRRAEEALLESEERFRNPDDLSGLGREEQKQHGVR